MSPQNTTGSPRAKKGEMAEDAAARFLVRKGYRIAARRFRAGRGEIDIIAEKGDWLVFVEVRSRSSTRFMEPAATVDRKKQHRIAMTAAAFLSGLKDAHRPTRFDIISVHLPENPEDPPGIEHIEAAFMTEGTLL